MVTGASVLPHSVTAPCIQVCRKFLLTGPLSGDINFGDLLATLDIGVLSLAAFSNRTFTPRTRNCNELILVSFIVKEC